MLIQIPTEKERGITSVWQKDIIQREAKWYHSDALDSPDHPAQWPGIVEVVFQNQEGVKQSDKTIQRVT